MAELRSETDGLSQVCALLAIGGVQWIAVGVEGDDLQTAALKALEEYLLRFAQ